MNSIKKTYFGLNLSYNSLHAFAKNLLSYSNHTSRKMSLYYSSNKSFARSTASSKEELEKRWKDHLQGFNKNWQKVKDDNYEK